MIVLLLYYGHQNLPFFQESIDRLEVAPEELSYRLSGLKVNYAYKFQVAAATMIGEGERSREVTQSPVHRGMKLMLNYTIYMYIFLLLTSD